MLLKHVMKFPVTESVCDTKQQLLAVKPLILAPYISSSKVHIAPKEESALVCRFLFSAASSEVAATTVLIFDTLTWSSVTEKGE